MEWPAIGRTLWWAFRTISRDYGMSGPLPISMVHIDCWQRVYGIRLTPWELEMISVFDSLMLASFADEHKRLHPEDRK